MHVCVLQVEHPVTEGITDTNIPSIQLMVGMGIPLWRIPALRATFTKDPKGDDFFDIETTAQRLPQKHVVAVRITSENASDGFKPTAGRVDEVSRRLGAGAGCRCQRMVWGGMHGRRHCADGFVLLLSR